MVAVSSCEPNKRKQIKTFRVYSIIVPIAIFLLVLEAIYIGMNIPGTLGNAKTTLGFLPKLPKGLLDG